VHRRLRELRRGKAIVWWKYDKRHWDQYVQDAWQAEKASLRRSGPTTCKRQRAADNVQQTERA
jgi:hypothetical protein